MVNLIFSSVILALAITTLFKSAELKMHLFFKFPIFIFTTAQTMTIWFVAFRPLTVLCSMMDVVLFFTGFFVLHNYSIPKDEIKKIRNPFFVLWGKNIIICFVILGLLMDSPFQKALIGFMNYHPKS